MAKTDNLTDFLTDIADAIREKKGTTGAINPQDFSSEIASIESGGGSSAVTSASVSDVNFYDYDGTILHSYTKEQFLLLFPCSHLKLLVADFLLNMRYNKLNLHDIFLMFLNLFLVYNNILL